ncbi:MAG TPA: hypothetical protein VKG82_03770 [Solirubrobacteraceae bacterium]|nr:hypothetical protein [Solirubrobacteraceae bacterium]
MTARHRFRNGVLALAALCAVALAVALGAGGGSSDVHPHATPADATTTAPAATSTSTGTSARAVAVQASTGQDVSSGRPARPLAAAAARREVPPGTLPQTHAYPSGTSPRFKSLMAYLWQGIVHDKPSRALPAFFPRSAYVQLKAIAGAGSDWGERLVHDYALDIAAAHELLGGDAAHARLIAVDVPSSYGHWIEPGVCYNSIGYYELPNARVVYREHGASRSFGIASMISWRGVWYVVHLGAILRSADNGEVDEPASGRGESLYSGTC